MTEEQINLKVATLAGGCFWCLASDFENISGVVKIVSGYTGGQKENPTYEEVSTGTTGHYEAIQVYYEPSQVSYEQVLDIFLHHIDPTDAGGQFADRGPQYRTAIFYHDDEQKRIAEKSKADLEQSGQFTKPVVTSIVKFSRFYEAEFYHQDYHKKSPVRYKLYRSGSGRDQFLDKTWGKEKEAGPNPEAPGIHSNKRSRFASDLIDDLRNYKARESSATGHVTYGALSSGHDDLVSALGYCVSYASKYPGNKPRVRWI